jgi:hypothetical protein
MLRQLKSSKVVDHADDRTVCLVIGLGMEMVDRDARNKAASVLRDFVTGYISNEEYGRLYPTSESDASLSEINIQIWFLYSDITEHKLTGKHALNVEELIFVERCILFLQSDHEFEWPCQRFRPWQILLQFLGSGKKIEAAADGDDSVWPFFDKSQFDRVLLEIKE